MNRKTDFLSEDRIFVGGYIPRRIADKLALFAAFHGLSKNAALESILSEHENLLDDQKTILLFAQNIYIKWKSQSRSPSFDEFKKLTRRALKKKIPSKYISQILMGMQRIYEKKGTN